MSEIISLKPFLVCLLLLYSNVTDLYVLIFHLVDFCWMYYQLWGFSCGFVRIFYVQIYTIPNKDTLTSSFLVYIFITSLCHAIVSTKIIGITLSRCVDSGHPLLFIRIFPSVFHFVCCGFFVYCLYFVDTCPLCPYFSTTLVINVCWILSKSSSVSNNIICPRVCIGDRLYIVFFDLCMLNHGGWSLWCVSELYLPELNWELLCLCSDWSIIF